ncbi:uncharacterized membrane protein YozB (DUF420 family) [Nocardioides thalensis]|uniref:Uncharacterized membrane protein YozB (DUF420 family) n=1 Tax=Nocardioides thalensis TaxID=1914755 RepID=A0A853C3Z4_9ACTN|nr:DUF2306 domain-containing protein [Nocardioides thalensis]NYJ01726.1 uncharacterized membrane protein YozB (DUF420 family) [Nocardioides thalensis]
MKSTRWSFVAWAAIAALCLLYGPMAIEYTWRLFNPDSPGLWDHTYAAIVDHDEAYGASSVHGQQEATYEANRLTLLFHTTAGGIAIMLFAAQFSARFRRDLGRHRNVGRVAGGLVLTTAVGSFLYLLSAGPEDTFDGPAFYVQLWALGIGAFASTALGIAAARKRQITMHQPLMALAFSMLLTAPLLRVGYLILGNTWPDSTQLETNLAGAAILATWAPFGAFLAARTMPVAARRHPDVRPWSGRVATIIAGTSALVATVVLVARAGAELDGLERVAGCSLAGWLAALAVALTRLAGAEHASVGAEEWRSMVVGLLAGVPGVVLLWSIYDLPFTSAEALVGALLTAPAITIVLALLHVIWRRRRPARQAPRERELVARAWQPS